MAVTAASLMQPNGPVDPSLYPDDTPPPATGAGSVLGRMQAYVDRAAAKVAALGSAVTDTDRAVEDWALHLAFADAYTIKLAKPANDDTGALGLGSQGYIGEQFKGLAQMRDAYRLAFEARVASAPAPRAPAASGAARVVFGW